MPKQNAVVNSGALPVLIAEAKNHAVSVTLPDSDKMQSLNLLLINIDQSSLLNDFIHAYGDSWKALAEKLIGKKTQANSYGVFFDNEMKMVYAFNTRLADYDRAKSSIVFKDPQVVLSELIMSFSPTQPSYDPTKPVSPNILFRYSLMNPSDPTIDPRTGESLI